MKCKSCDAEYNGFFAGCDGECDNCYTQSVAASRAKQVEEIELAKSLGITVWKLRKDLAETPELKAAEKIEAAKLAAFILTTETSHNLPVTERLGIVTAEAVLGMNAFKDLFAGLRDVVGGRSKTLEKGLRDAREICLTELKRNAIKLGADAVVAIDLDYQDLGTNGKMLMVVATGTAIKLG